MKVSIFLCVTVCGVLAFASAQAATVLGDWGHFLSYSPRMHLHNPDGRAFTVSVHVMQWGNPAWNKPVHKVRLTSPDGTVIHDGEMPLHDAAVVLDVPAGVSSFQVRVRSEMEEDILKMEICAPDRTIAMIYDKAGERTVQVPPGLDGKMWYLRPSVGSASRLVTHAGTAPRYQNIRMTLEMKGVPDGLAPTWEQWFDAERPVPVLARPGAAAKER